MRCVTIAAAILFTVLTAARSQEGQKADRPDVKPGDSWTYERVDRKTGGKLEVRREIKAVAGDSLTLVVQDAAGTTEQEWTRELNYMRGEGKRVTRPHQQYVSFPLTVGREWKVEAKGVNASGRDVTSEGKCKVAAFEKVSVRAGPFDAFKVECDVEFYIYGPGIRGRDNYVYWYAPVLRGEVRAERLTRDASTVFFDWTQELVATNVK